MGDTVIQHLRRKIVLAFIVTVLVSLAALIFSINYAHYLQVDTNLRTAMDEIASSMDAGALGHQVHGATPQGEGAGQPVDKQVTTGNDGTGTDQTVQNRMMHGERKSARTQYANRFFCVFVTSDGEMTVRAKGNDSLGDDDARILAQRVLASGAQQGFMDDYKYAIESLNDDTGANEQPGLPDVQTRILFLDCTTDLQSLHQLLMVSLAVGGCAFLVAAIFAFRFAKLAIRPLEESTQKQKRFVADAGHELKTPLSVIATNMDILEADLAGQPEEQEWIDSTNRQVANMRHLVNDLIVLSKMEEQQADLVLTEVSLTDLAYECTLTFEQLARTQGKELVSSIEEDVCVRADEPSVRQLMTILVDNAIKYATGDGSVQVEARRDGRSAVFLTRNSWNHDVEPQELASLFDRFVRAEQSRDRSVGAGGYGLGLSIARAIAQRNNAKLEVNEDSSGKIVFRAVFRNATRS